MVFGGPTTWVLVLHFLLLTEGAPNKSVLSDLLKPQLHLQITLRVPEHYKLRGLELPPALRLAMDLLLSEQAPFRLFYNLTRGKPLSVVTPSPRFTQNQATWLVFVSVQSKSEVLDLDKILQSCTLGSKFGLSTVVHRDFLQLIVDESALAEPWRTNCKFNIVRAYVPLYLVILSCSGTHCTSDDARLLRETCKCDGGSHFTSLQNFIPELNGPNGVDGILKKIRSEKMNFSGRRVMMCPSEIILGTWESKWKRFFIPFSFRAAHENWESALASLFDSLIAKHNFTLDFATCAGISYGPTSRAIVRMSSTFVCTGPLYQCYIFPLSLFRFEYFRTVFFSRSIQPGSYSLFSLQAPFSHPFTALLLLGTSICVSITLAIVSKSRDITAAFLSIFSGLLGKSLSISDYPKSANFYLFWLLLAGVVSVTYTNILQSYVVVPGVRFNDLSFEDMVKQNYTFESSYCKWMKRWITHKATVSMSTEERMLSEHVSERVTDLTRVAASKFINYYSVARKSAVVQSGAETEIMTLIAKATEWNAVLGKETFFNFPLWWNFGQIERASLLLTSVEGLKEAGILYYFLQLLKSKSHKFIVALSSKKETNSTYVPGTTHTAYCEGSSASLNDALVSECFALFMYGIVTAVVVFLIEQFSRIRKPTQNTA